MLLKVSKGIRGMAAAILLFNIFCSFKELNNMWINNMWITNRKMNNWVIILGTEKHKQLFIPVILTMNYGNIPVDY